MIILSHLDSPLSHYSILSMSILSIICKGFYWGRLCIAHLAWLHGFNLLLTWVKWLSKGKRENTAYLLALNPQTPSQLLLSTICLDLLLYNYVAGAWLLLDFCSISCITHSYFQFQWHNVLRVTIISNLLF